MLRTWPSENTGLDNYAATMFSTASSSSRSVLADGLIAFKQLRVLNVDEIRAYATERQNAVSFDGENQVIAQL